MRSIILRLALTLAAFTIVPDALAAGTDGGNFFLDGKFGESFADQSGYSGNARSAWGADGGYRWILDDARSLGFEVGYMHFGQIFGNFDPMGFFSEQVSSSAISLGGNFQVLIGDDKAWYVQARAGLVRAKFDQSVSDFAPGQPATTSSYSWRQNGSYVGVGIGRHITQSFSLMLAYAGYNSSGMQDQNGPHPGLDVNWLGLVAEYRF